MKKLLVLTSLLLICGASIASAALPGANLSWSNCSTVASASNYQFLCDDNALVRNLVTSYRLANPLPDFVAVGVVIDFAIGDPATPAWYQFGAGGCREGSFNPINVGALTGCTNSYAGAGQAGGSVIEQTAPNKWRIRGQWARDAGFPIAQAANTLYSAFVLQLNTAGSLDEGDGNCPGCEAPACFVVNSLGVYGLNSGLAADITGADFRQYATYQGGAVGGGGCPGETPTKNTTWGAVKALYR